ncbi:MAG: tyrosine-type recombinase/integrase [Chitinispirillaceae bacterium]|nr:tyrosine-type recombinase/integrase [Chitinispirillaceae bacterium]
MRIKRLGDGQWHIDIHVYPKYRIYRTFPGKSRKATLQEAKEQAQKWEKELLAKRDKEQAPKNLNFTRFDQVLEHWKGSPDRNGNKRKTKDYIYERLMSDLGYLPLDEVREGLKRLQFMLKDEVTRKKTKYTNSTINRFIADAKRADSQAFIDGKIKKQYLLRYQLLNEDNIRYRIINDQERKKLYEILPEWLKPLWYFSSRVPCRISELVNLKKSNLHLESNRLHLDGSLAKNGEPRKLTIYPEMIEYFSTLPEECEYLFFRKTSKIIKPIGYFGADGKVIPNIIGHWNKTLNDAKITGYNWHKTRQQAAMQMIADDFSERVVKMIGGWKSDAAFNRYINDQMVYDIQTKAIKFDNGWYESMEPKAATYYLGLED